MSKQQKKCALCGKELKGLDALANNTVFGRDFCTGCYGYVSILCKTPDDLGRYTIDDLKARYARDACELCGKKLEGPLAATHKKFVRDGLICKDCEKLLRPYYEVGAGEKGGALVANVISAAFALVTDSALTDTFAAQDPMELATVNELRTAYEAACR